MLIKFNLKIINKIKIYKFEKILMYLIIKNERFNLLILTLNFAIKK